jgi:putative heme iron utilization protein
MPMDLFFAENARRKQTTAQMGAKSFNSPSIQTVILETVALRGLDGVGANGSSIRSNGTHQFPSSLSSTTPPRPPKRNTKNMNLFH